MTLFAPIAVELKVRSLVPSSNNRVILEVLTPLNLVKLPKAIVLLSANEITFKTELSKPTPAVK